MLRTIVRPSISCEKQSGSAQLSQFELGDHPNATQLCAVCLATFCGFTCPGTGPGNDILEVSHKYALTQSTT